MAWIRAGLNGGSGGIPFTLTVTCDEDFVGEILTFSNGTTILTETVPSSMTVVFSIPAAGTWTLSNSLTSDTEVFNITSEYTAELVATPDGKTVTPTDDIQIWLKCASIKDKAYTTLAEVLADTTTLLALINSPNAVDYMVRSTTWAVAPKLIPVMTDNTHPSGVASASSTFSGLYPYYTFDGTTSTWWASASSGTQYIRYKFDNATVVNRLYMITAQMDRSNSIAFQGSNDGSNWTTIKTLDRSAIMAHDQQPYIERVTNNTAYLYYQIYMSTNTLGVTFQELNFFNEDRITDDSTAMSYIGLNNYCANTLLADSTWCNAICNSTYFESVLNVKVPTMTSNTTPSGMCFASSERSGREAYVAFDGTSNAWQTSNTSTTFSNIYVGYKFDSAKKSVKAVFTVGTPQITAMTYKFQGSTGDNTWHDLTGELTTFGTSPTTVVFGNIGDYRFYRMLIINQSHSESEYGGMISTLQFYGRKDV